MRHRKITPFLSDSWVHKYSGEMGLVVPNSLPLLPQPSSLRSPSHGRKSFFFFFLIITSLTYIKNTWFKKKNTFIYLFNCACVACRIFASRQGLNPCPLQWKCRALTTGLPGNSHNSYFFNWEQVLLEKKHPPSDISKYPGMTTPPSFSLASFDPKE